MTSRRMRVFWWFIFIAAAIYLFLPLFGTFMFSIRAQPPISGYTGFLQNPRFYSTLGYSFVVGILTILVSILILVPTAFWVRLRLPRARPFVEFVTLLPFVVPPIVLVFGLISTYSGPPLSLTATNTGSDFLLVAAYVVLSFPYMYRAIDTGLRSIDIRSLTEASQSLGAGWIRILWQIILPNIRVAILSGAFLTLAIVVGEFTIANMLARPAFAPYLGILGDEVDPYQQAAVALVAFGLTWIAMGLISLLGRGGRSNIQVTGAR
jgi:putative spermidine/putrescine transport system permease protein